MAHVRTGKARALLRSSPSGSFDQYLLDIQKLPMITDPEEEKRLARRALAGDEAAAERLVTANLRFVISYVKKYQGHGLDLSELVAMLQAEAEQLRAIGMDVSFSGPWAPYRFIGEHE